MGKRGWRLLEMDILTTQAFSFHFTSLAFSTLEKG
jgi:hypothetical protein